MCGCEEKGTPTVAVILPPPPPSARARLPRATPRAADRLGHRVVGRRDEEAWRGDGTLVSTCCPTVNTTSPTRPARTKKQHISLAAIEVEPRTLPRVGLAVALRRGERLREHASVTSEWFYGETLMRRAIFEFHTSNRGDLREDADEHRDGPVDDRHRRARQRRRDRVRPRERVEARDEEVAPKNEIAREQRGVASCPWFEMRMLVPNARRDARQLASFVFGRLGSEGRSSFAAWRLPMRAVRGRHDHCAAGRDELDIRSTHDASATRTRHKTQDARHKTQDARHKTPDTRHKTQEHKT